MRRWNLPQVNTKVMCAVLTAAMVMTGFTACGGSTTASAASTEASENKETIAPERTTESTEGSEEKAETYLDHSHRWQCDLRCTGREAGSSQW